MPTATIVKAWKDKVSAYIAIRVAEAQGNVEYIASVPLADLADKALAEQKATLVAAAKSTRDATMSSESTISISGNVSI